MEPVRDFQIVEISDNPPEKIRPGEMLVPLPTTTRAVR